MKELIKHLEQGTAIQLGEQVSFLPGQIVSKTLAQNVHHSLTLFAFDRGEEISTHESAGGALVTVLEGEGRITIDGVEHVLHSGESIVMPAQIPHAVFALQQFKMMLLVLFPNSSQQ